MLVNLFLMICSTLTIILACLVSVIGLVIVSLVIISLLGHFVLKNFYLFRYTFESNTDTLIHLVSSNFIEDFYTYHYNTTINKIVYKLNFFSLLCYFIYLVIVQIDEKQGSNNEKHLIYFFDKFFKDKHFK